VICGRIHTAVLKQLGQGFHCNTGDWIENSDGLVEHPDGSFQLVSRYAEGQTLQLQPAVDSPAFGGERPLSGLAGSASRQPANAERLPARQNVAAFSAAMSQMTGPTLPNLALGRYPLRS